jgi:hypothetical protein
MGCSYVWEPQPVVYPCTNAVRNTKDLIAPVSAECREAVYDKKNPEALFATCFRGLDKIEQQRFVFMNMLEKLKQHSQPLNQVVEHFNHIGLIDVPLDAPPPSDPESTRSTPSARQQGTRTILRARPQYPSPAAVPEAADVRKPSWIFSRLMWALRKFAEGLIEASIMVAKVVFGQFMKAIQPNVGFSGPWPTITWTIETDAFEYETLKVFVEKFRLLQFGEAPSDLLDAVC